MPTALTRKTAEKAGWIFDYSKSLDMEYAWRETAIGIEVMTDDRIKYTPDEIRIISTTAGEITRDIHMVKRIFQGRVVDLGEWRGKKRKKRANLHKITL